MLVMKRTEIAKNSKLARLSGRFCATWNAVVLLQPHELRVRFPTVEPMWPFTNKQSRVVWVDPKDPRARRRDRRCLEVRLNWAYDDFNYGSIKANCADGWVTSPNKGVRCCAFCWRRQRRSQCAVCPRGARSTPPHDASRAQDRQGGDGEETGRCSLLDVAQGMELRAVKKFGSHAGQLGTGDGVPSNTE